MRKLFALLLVVVLVGAACSDDGDDGDDAASSDNTKQTISPDTTIRSLAADEIDATASPYCATWAEIRSQGGPKTQGLDDAAAAARRKEYYGGLIPLVERLLSQADDEIRPSVQNALDNTRNAATTGSFDSFRTDESKEHTGKLAQYALDHCQKA